MKQNNGNNERSAFAEAWDIMKKLLRAILVPFLKIIVDAAEKIESKKAEKSKSSKAPKAKKAKEPKRAKEHKKKEPKNHNVKKEAEKSENNQTDDLKAPITVDTPAPRARRAEFPDDFKVKKVKKEHREIISVRERRERKKQQKKDIIKYCIFAVIAALFLMCVVFFATRLYGSMRFNDVADSAHQFIEGTGRGKGYPYSINSVDVIDMQPMSSNVAVLTQDTFLLLNSSAKEVVRHQHGYSEPAISIYGDMALLYDKATGRFTVLNSNKVLRTGDMKRGIYNATMNSDGSLAFSLKSDKAACEVEILSGRLEKKFSKKYGEEKALDIAVSPSGRGAAIVFVGSKRAQLYSRVVLVDFKKEEPVKIFNYPETAVFDVIYETRGRIVAYSEDTKSTIKNKKERLDDYKFPLSEILFEDTASSGRSAIVVEKHGNEDNKKVALFDKKGKLRFESTFKDRISAISCGNNYVAVLLENKAVLLKNNGKIAKEYKTDKNGKRIVNIGNDVYILHSSCISKNS